MGKEAQNNILKQKDNNIAYAEIFSSGDYETSDLNYFTWVEINSGGQYDNDIFRSDKNFLGTVGIIHDVSERRFAEKALKSNEERFRALIENSSDIISIVNARGKLLYISPSIEKILGYKVEELTDQPVFNLISPEDITQLTEAYREIIRNKELNIMELRARHKNGDWRNFEITAVNLICDISINGFVINARDITDRKLAEENIIKLSHAVEQSPTSVIITDLKGNIEYVNPKFTELTGYTFDDVKGKNPRILKTGNTPQEEYKILWDTISTGNTWQGEFQNKKKNGENYWEYAHISPIKNRKGIITHYLAVKEDITDRKIADQKLQSTIEEVERLNNTLGNRIKEEVRKNREKDLILIKQGRQAAMGEMLGNIAHQWRQPLNNIGLLIQNMVQALEHGKLDKSYLENNVTKGMKIIQYMSQTIDDFRNFFKPNKGKDEFSVKEALLRAVSFVDASFKNNNISIEMTADRDFKITGYPNEYSQVILNILANSKDAFIERSIKDAVVKISLNEKNGHSSLSISDNAGGIKEDIIERIFEPYFTTKLNGTGIGLYMSKMIIEKNMGGKLTCRNSKNGVEFLIDV